MYLIVLWLILRTLKIGSFLFFEHDFGCFRPGVIPRPVLLLYIFFFFIFDILKFPN